MNTINLDLVREYLDYQLIEDKFDIISAKQAEMLQAFGVPYIEYPLPRGQGYVYAGYLVFQWTEQGPFIVQH